MLGGEAFGHASPFLQTAFFVHEGHSTPEPELL
jgi:hypothetical protein